MPTVIGTVSKLRRMSKHLTFVDMICDRDYDSDECSADQGVTYCVYVKFENITLPKCVKPGLKISVACMLEPGPRALRWDGKPPTAMQAISAPDILSLQSSDGCYPDTITPPVLKDRSWPLCRLWASGVCSGACKSRHEFLPGEEAMVFRQAERAALTRAAAMDAADPHENKMCKGAHNRIFAEWLVHTFGDLLRTGHGVVDIAGGSGVVSEILACEHEIECTLIDPRPLRVSSQRRRRMRKLALKQSRVTPSVHMEEVPTEDIHEWPVCDFEPPPAFESTTPPAYTDGLPFRHIKREFPGEVGGEAQAAAAKASVLIGMHSDDATEAIVDKALCLGKPFACVPCCVFPSRHPERLTPQGGPVTTTDEFVAYLRAKDAKIQLAYLPFVGRNKVVYCF